MNEQKILRLTDGRPLQLAAVNVGSPDEHLEWLLQESIRQARQQKELEQRRKEWVRRGRKSRSGSSKP